MNPLLFAAAALGLASLTQTQKKQRVLKSRTAADFARRLRRALEPHKNWDSPVLGGDEEALIEYGPLEITIERAGSSGAFNFYARIDGTLWTQGVVDSAQAAAKHIKQAFPGALIYPRLVNGEAMHRQHPDTFHIPSREDRSRLRLDDYAKLSVSGERFWVKVIDIDENEIDLSDETAVLYLGKVEQSDMIGAGHGIRHGMPIMFSPEHVLDIEWREDYAARTGKKPRRKAKRKKA